MKKIIRKAVLSVLGVFTTLLVVGQANNKFYASIEDYKNNKPISGYDIQESSWLEVLGKESIKVTTASGTEKMSMSKLPSELYTYRDMLIRAYKGKSYIVLVEGPLCYYASYSTNAIQFYSETIAGDLKDFSEKVFKKILDQHGMKTAYEKDKPKREMKDSVDDYFNKTVNRNIKYFKLLNEKLK
jgi:hypothetical protein